MTKIVATVTNNLKNIAIPSKTIISKNKDSKPFEYWATVKNRVMIRAPTDIRGIMNSLDFFNIKSATNTITIEAVKINSGIKYTRLLTLSIKRPD